MNVSQTDHLRDDKHEKDHEQISVQCLSPISSHIMLSLAIFGVIFLQVVAAQCPAPSVTTTISVGNIARTIRAGTSAIVSKDPASFGSLRVSVISARKATPDDFCTGCHNIVWSSIRHRYLGRAYGCRCHCRLEFSTPSGFVLIDR